MKPIKGKTSGNSMADYTEIKKKCDNCNGTGEEITDDGDEKRCEECSGKGYIIIRY